MASTPRLVPRDASWTAVRVVVDADAIEPVIVLLGPTPGDRNLRAESAVAPPGTEILLSTNTGGLKNVILEGNVLGSASTATQESDGDKKGSRR
jgi:hypothetical protein